MSQYRSIFAAKELDRDSAMSIMDSDQQMLVGHPITLVIEVCHHEIRTAGSASS
jgi:hypothetical protein